jgi:hypothetical protein
VFLKTVAYAATAIFAQGPVGEMIINPHLPKENGLPGRYSSRTIRFSSTDYKMLKLRHPA